MAARTSIVSPGRGNPRLSNPTIRPTTQYPCRLTSCCSSPRKVVVTGIGTCCRLIGRAQKPSTIENVFVVPLPTAQCRAMHLHCTDDVSRNPHRGLLRAHRERPRRRAAEQRDKLAAFHCELPPVLATGS